MIVFFVRKSYSCLLVGISIFHEVNKTQKALSQSCQEEEGGHLFFFLTGALFIVSQELEMSGSYTSTIQCVLRTK